MNHIHILIVQIIAMLIRIRLALIGILSLFFCSMMFMYHVSIPYDRLYTITEMTTLLFSVMLINTALPRRYRFKLSQHV